MPDHDVRSGTRAKVFNLTFDGGCELHVHEIWPDDDAPENPTAKDVAIQIRRMGTVTRFLSEWNVAGDLDIYVDGEAVRLV